MLNLAHMYLLGQKLGVDTYFSYLEKFGLLSKTGVDLPGEANSIFIAKEKAGPVELASLLLNNL